MNPKSNLSWLPWALSAAFMAALWPSLNATYLQEVDELIYARVALEAGRDGHWMPLNWGGQLWSEKPPLLLWAAAATARLSGDFMASWPYRLWSCLGAAACVGILARLGMLAGGGWLAGLLAGGLFALQGDLIFHARFFTMDTAVLAAALGAALLAARGRYTSAGLALALGVWFKSWFIVAFFPALAFALLNSGVQRKDAAWLFALPLLSLAAVTLLYWWAYGPDYLRQELWWNLLDRARGLSNERVESNLSYYGKWALRTAAMLPPLALAAPAFLLSAAPSSGPRRFIGRFAAGLSLSWLGMLCVVKAQVINYLLPMEAGLVLCLAVALASGEGGARAWILAALGALSLASALRLPPVEVSLTLSAALGLALYFPANSGQAVSRAAGLAALLAAALCAALLTRSATRYLLHPDNPSQALAEALLKNPARYPGEPLAYAGPPSQAIHFYSRYAVRRLERLPALRPAEATLVATADGPRFYPPVRGAKP